MTTAARRIVVQSIGECMVEIAGDSDAAPVGYSGDTYNTAVYLKRATTQRGLPIEVRYLSGLGDDTESDLMRARWISEGIVDDAVVLPGRAPGRYLITTDARGERTFSYWRDGSAAATLLFGGDWVDRVHGDYVYLSGVTLQLMSGLSRANLVARLSSLRAAGTRVVFDSNYRPPGWQSAGDARQAMAEILRVTDIALVTWEDEHALTGCPDVPACVERLAALGVPEIVVKDGPQGAWVREDGELVQVAARVVEPLDTTAAGDSFNAAYLAARIAGDSPRIAAAAGNALGAQVVMHRGAIVDPAWEST